MATSIFCKVVYKGIHLWFKARGQFSAIDAQQLVHLLLLLLDSITPKINLSAISRSFEFGKYMQSGLAGLPDLMAAMDAAESE